MEQIFLNLLEVSLGGVLVIAVMLLISPLAGKKFSAKWRYWIWLALALRLLLPFEFSLPDPPITVTVPQQLVAEQNFVAKAEEETGILQGGTAASALTSNEDIIVETETVTPTVSPETQKLWQPTLLELLALVWLAGVVVSVIWQGITYIRWQKDCRLWNRPVEDGDVLDLYYDLCRELGISKFPQLMQNRRVQSPMMIGLLNPAILLPDMKYSEEDYAVVLTHELNHYKRHDLWYKLLMLLARCVHWFNPLVWLMLREAGNDLEITCDEAVVRNHSGEDRALYCETILRIMCRGKGKYAVLSTGFNGGKKVLQRRFSAVLNEKASRGLALGAAAMVLVLFCGGLVACELTEQAEEIANTPVTSEKTEVELPKEEDSASLVQENNPQVSETAKENASIEETQPTEKSSQSTTPAVTVVNSDSGDKRYEPFKQGFRGLDVHATEQYETLNYYTTDSSAIAAIMEELDWENKQPAQQKKELYTHDVDLSGQFIRLVTDNMEQLYVYQDQDQALYRDKAGNCTYYDVDERTYDDLFGAVDEVSQWKLNPVTDSRSEPFDENYSTLDIYAQELEPREYSLTIRTFCEMLIDDLNWEEIAERDENISDYLSPIDLSDGYWLRISTNTGRHLYIYKDHPYGVYYTGHGNEHYYKLPSGTYERVLKLLKTYSIYQKPGAEADQFPFQERFTNVTVSLHDDGELASEKTVLGHHESFRMMAGVPTGYFVRADKKEELTLDQGTFVLMENFDGQKLAIYEGKSQAKYWAADGKVAYYELGADYYDIARMVAEKVAGWTDLREAITLTPTAESWPVGTETIKVILENKTERRLNGAESFKLEVRKNGKWVEVTHPDSSRKVNPDIGVVYEPQSQNTILVDLTNRFGELAAGHYRLTMTSVTSNPSAEFELKNQNMVELIFNGQQNGVVVEERVTLEDEYKERVYALIRELKPADVNPNTPMVDTITVSITENRKTKNYQFIKGGKYVFCVGEGAFYCPSGAYEMLEGDMLENLQVNPETAKPVIYLYPEETMDVSIKLDYNGQLTTTYPAYNNGWKVTAQPDGTILSGGREYYCLFWEGLSNVDYDLSSGFVVKGSETEAFLEKSLKQLGLTDKEANEFIIYWLPKMESNPYNLISFQQEVYTDNAVLTIDPQPNSLIRVFMAWKGLDQPIRIPSQNLKAVERSGFTVVEWGGSEMK